VNFCNDRSGDIGAVGYILGYPRHGSIQPGLLPRRPTSARTPPVLQPWRVGALDGLPGFPGSIM